MPDLRELKNLIDDFENQYQLSEEHQGLIAAVKEINDYTALLRETDRYGRTPYVTQANKELLMKMHRNVAEKSEALLKGEDSEELKEMIRKISALASANYSQIAGYDPVNDPKTITALEEEVRMITLDLRGTPDPEKRGANSNSRQVLSFMDEKGRVVTGLFTPKNVINSYDEMSQAVTDTAKKARSEKGKQILENFFENLRKYHRLEENDKDTICRMLIYNTQKMKEVNGQKIPDMKNCDPAKLAEYIAKVTSDGSEIEVDADDVVNEIGAQNLVDLNDVFSRHIVNAGLNIGNGGMTNGSRTDSRNSAMSAVADLLGAPSLIARSRPMKIIDQNGQEIEGTFMLEAKGLDYNNPSEEADAIDETSVADPEGRGLKSLADLQVIDYLSGNIDRHQGNMFYQFDENHKLIGVVGIDNDCAFGDIAPDKEGQNHLAAPKDMIAVSESMYKKVMALQPDELKYALRGYELSEQELDAAAKRLRILKETLNVGKGHYEAVDEEMERNEEYGDYLDGDEDFEFSEDEDQIKKNLEPQNAAEELYGKPKKNHYAFRMDPGYVRIIPDNEFYRMTQKHIQAEEKRGNAENIFALGNFAVSNIARRRLSAEEDYKKLQGKVTLQADNRCFPEEQKKAKEQASAMVTTLDRNTKWLRSSSNYRDMETAAENYEKFQKKLEERIRLANRPNVKNKKDYRLDLEAIVTPEDLRKMQELSEKLEKAAEKYLKGKLGKGEKLEDYSPYTQDRIRTARTVVENAKKNKIIKSYEKNAAEVNAREARENLARRLGNQKEAQDIKKGRVKAPLQDAPKKGL